MKRLFFIGIMGHAMRGLAYAAQQRGDEVSGWDPSQENEAVGYRWLTDHEIKWNNEIDFELPPDIDEVIISGGTGPDDLRTVAAQQRNIPVVSFAEFLGDLTTGKHVISVAGSHGKTTTTSLIAWLLEDAGRHPDFLIGIQPFNFDASARIEGADVVVIEGDEYKASSLDNRSKVELYHPDVLVLTSLEMDHPDVFRDLAHITDRFQLIVNAVPATGSLVIWAESEAVMGVIKQSTSKAKVVTYGLSAGDVLAGDVAFEPGGIAFDLIVGSNMLGRLTVGLYGRHNVLNSLAAAAVALGEGLSFDEIRTGAATFKGAYRRFNVLTEVDTPITVIDDYAHHPTEVATTIEAAKLHYPGRRLIAVFRPHTYSRTRTLLPEFQNAFGDADVAYITDVEGARESGQEATVSGADVVEGIGAKAVFEPDRTRLIERIVADAKPADVILCMTVSGYEGLAGELASQVNMGR